MASFVRPHPPLDAPEYYLNLYKDKPLAEPWRGDWNDCVRWERRRPQLPCPDGTLG